MATKEELLETAKWVKSKLIERGGRFLCFSGNCTCCPASRHNNADGKRCVEAGRDSIEFFTNYIEQNEEKGMKTQIEKLKKDLAELEAQYEKEQKEKKRVSLHLEVGGHSGDLNIVYKNRLIGEITASGKCYILNNEPRVEIYEEWRAAGVPFSEETVIWRGGTYCILQISGYIRLCRVTTLCREEIYDFTCCNAKSNCEDSNIIRFKHNNKPRLF